eukprot:8555714-Pyramimonas_sp.AAC.1
MSTRSLLVSGAAAVQCMQDIQLIPPPGFHPTLEFDCRRYVPSVPLSVLDSLLQIFYRSLDLDFYSPTSATSR